MSGKERYQKNSTLDSGWRLQVYYPLLYKQMVDNGVNNQNLAFQYAMQSIAEYRENISEDEWNDKIDKDPVFSEEQKSEDETEKGLTGLNEEMQSDKEEETMMINTFEKPNEKSARNKNKKEKMKH